MRVAQYSVFVSLLAVFLVACGGGNAGGAMRTTMTGEWLGTFNYRVTDRGTGADEKWQGYFLANITETPAGVFNGDGPFCADVGQGKKTSQIAVAGTHITNSVSISSLTSSGIPVSFGTDKNGLIITFYDLYLQNAAYTGQLSNNTVTFPPETLPKPQGSSLTIKITELTFIAVNDQSVYASDCAKLA